jgi:hypothetical protein
MRFHRMITPALSPVSISLSLHQKKKKNSEEGTWWKGKRSVPRYQNCVPQVHARISVAGYSKLEWCDRWSTSPIDSDSQPVASFTAR